LLNAEIGLAAFDDSQKNQSFWKVIDNSHRAKDIIKQLLVFTKGQPATYRPTNVAALINETMQIVKSMVPSTIAIKKRIFDDNITINADASQIQQIIINLCANAAQAMDAKKGGSLYMGLEEADLSEVEDEQSVQAESCIALVVADTGCGIPPENINQIFAPFFSTKERDSGTGMGLAIVQGIVEKHNGTIKVESSEGMGTSFRIVFPVIRHKEVKQYYTEEAMAGIDSYPEGNETILLVDDEKALLLVGKKILATLGYTVVAIDSGTQALEEFRRRPEMFDIVIADMTMPDMTGIELLENIVDIRKDIAMVICSGMHEASVFNRAQSLGAGYVAKPFSIQKIAQTVRRTIEASL